MTERKIVTLATSDMLLVAPAAARSYVDQVSYEIRQHGGVHSAVIVRLSARSPEEWDVLQFRFMAFPKANELREDVIDPSKILAECMHLRPVGFAVEDGGRTLVVLYAAICSPRDNSLESAEHRDVLADASRRVRAAVEAICAEANSRFKLERWTNKIVAR